MARILVSIPPIEGALAALADHDLNFGAPGSDAGAQALLCAPMQRVDAQALADMPELRAIALAGAGADGIDGAAARARGITVLTAGEPLVATTADLAFALILASARRLGEGDRRVRAGEWTGWRFVDEDFGRDVHGARLGLVGYGRIARAVARRAAGFDMEVRHHCRRDSGVAGWVADLDELLRWCEVASIHVPLDESTRGLIDARRIDLLGPEGVLVNTARGAVVDEEALALALTEGRLLAAGLDVYAHEPVVPAALLAAPRTVLLPHLGSATVATRRAMLRTAAEKLARLLAGDQPL